MDTKLKTAIIAALGSLDTKNDEHWTTEGMPRMDAVEDIVKQDLTRADITAAAKGFSRKNPALETEAKGKDGTATGEPEKDSMDHDATTEEQATKPKPAHVVQLDDPATKPRTADDKTPVTANLAEAATIEVGEQTPDETANLPEAEQAQVDLNAKRAALAIAQRELSEAQKRMDVVTLEALDENTAITNAQAIKNYQKSQQAQRLRQAEAAK